MVYYNNLLLPMFYELRKRGISLGVSDYMLIIEALHMGMGLQDNSTLRRLCRLLWAKSAQDLEIVDTVFSTYVEPYFFSTPEIVLSSADAASSPSIMPPLANSLPPHKYGKEQQEKFHTTFSGLSESQPADITSSSSTSSATRSYDLPPRHTTNIITSSFFPSSQRTYHMRPRLPLDQREMIEAIRHLRRSQRTGILEEIDIEKTIQSICQIGFFLGPVLQPRYHNQVHLHLLLDQQGSMVPFSTLIDELTESIQHSKLSNKTHVYYFHDCPEEFIYEHSTLTVPCSLIEVLTEQVRHDAVLIVSDAGAARGRYDSQRVADTKTFIQTLNEYTYLYAWLNPLPFNKWVSTTAEDISHIVPMFPLTREGLLDAIAILQGQPFPPEVGINGRSSQ